MARAPVRVPTSLAAACCLLSLGGCHDREASGTRPAWAPPTDAEIRELAASHVDANGVGMVIGIVDSNGRRIVSHGMSRARGGRPVSGESVFQLGSATKPITTLLLSDMVVRGEVAFDDPISLYVPDSVALPDAVGQITLRQLASHMSGLPSMPDNFDLRGDPDPYASYTVSELWSYMSSYRLPSSAGSQYLYSNLGVSLLGRLLAAHLGDTYETAVRRRVLDPLGMSSTTITLDTDLMARAVDGHGPYRNPVRTWEMATLQASGSLRSTAEDMLLILEAYLGYRETPLEPAIEAQLNGAAEGPLSWGTLEDGTFRHAGGKAGYRSGVAFNRRTGIGAVVLANIRTFESIPIQIATHLVAGTPLPAPSVAPGQKSVTPITSEELEMYEGTYALPNGGEIEVVSNGTHLLARYENQSIWEFAPTGRDGFFLVSGNDDLVFDRSEEGTVRGLTRYGDGRGRGGAEFARRIH